MSRNSSGTYTAPANSWNPAVEGAAIDEADWNATLADLESALTDSLDRTGKGKITAHIDFDENASPGTPDSNVGRLYAADDSGLTTVYWKDSAGNVYNLLQGAASGLTYVFNSTTTTNADPGAGKAALNNATIGSATEMAISTTTAAGASIATYIGTWDDNGTTDRGRVFIQKRTNPAIIHIFKISGANTDASGYKRLALTYVDGTGTLSNTDPITIAFGSPGPAGSAGATGPNMGLDYTWSTSTGTPSTGQVLVDNATLASATTLKIHESNAQSASQAATLATWDDSTSSVKGMVRIVDVAAPGTNWIEYNITGPITDAGSYDTFPITYVNAAGTISNGASVSVAFFPKGDAGAGSGDFSSNTATSVDGEVVLFSGTGGKTGKRATGSGLAKLTSGVLSTATGGTDYADLAFKTISVSGQSDVVADSAADTLTLAAGSNITITTDAGTDTITIAASGGGSGSPSRPQGRLSLSTGVPVMSSTVSAATTVYYTPYVGRYVPIYDGTSWTMTDIGGELSQTTTDTTKSPAACTTNSNYDLFVWNDSGTYRCTRGPAWSSDTSRGTGAGTTELQMVAGIYTNKIAITNGPAANRGTYVGTIRTNGSSQVDYIFGGSASGGTAAKIGVWNMYNRVNVSTLVNDSTASWTTTSTSAQALNAGGTGSGLNNRVSYVLGLAEDSVAIALACRMDGAGGNGTVVGIGIDSTTVSSAQSLSVAVASAIAMNVQNGQLGWHFVQALQLVGGGTGTYIGASGQEGLRVDLRM